MSLVSFPYTPSLFVRSRDCEEKSYFLPSNSRATRSAEVMKKENFPHEDHFPSARWWEKWKGQRRKLDEKNWYSRVVLLRRENCDEICAGKVQQRSAKKKFCCFFSRCNLTSSWSSFSVNFSPLFSYQTNKTFFPLLSFCWLFLLTCAGDSIIF